MAQPTPVLCFCSTLHIAVLAFFKFEILFFLFFFFFQLFTKHENGLQRSLLGALFLKHKISPKLCCLTSFGMNCKHQHRACLLEHAKDSKNAELQLVRNQGG